MISMFERRHLFAPPTKRRAESQVNNIGVPGTAGFGVGVCPAPPSGFTAMTGCSNPASDNYGNYTYQDGSVMVWVPAFFYQVGALDALTIKRYSKYPSVAAANAAGFALHRAFYDGTVQPGFFVDKYQWCLHNYNSANIASSLPGAIAITGPGRNPNYAMLTGLTGADGNEGGSFKAAKTRGSDFFPISRFQWAALAMLAKAHGDAAASTANCAWWVSSGSRYPRGNDYNYQHKSYDDTAVLFEPDGTGGLAKTGSAGYGGGAGNVFAKSTHNGQNCGIADLVGNLWEFNSGITAQGGEYYAVKPTVRMKDLTGGTTGATDHFGAAGIAANFDQIPKSVFLPAGVEHRFSYGNGSNRVLSSDVSGDNWVLTCAGLPPLAAQDVHNGGTDAFGKDYYRWDNVNNATVLSGGTANEEFRSGLWCIYMGDTAANGDDVTGSRSGLYL